MKANDARQLPLEAKHELHKMVVRLHEQGKNRREISRLTGLSYNAVCNIVTKYVEGGRSKESVRPGKPGRKAGRDRLLSAEQEREIQKMICDKRPATARKTASPASVPTASLTKDILSTPTTR